MSEIFYSSHFSTSERCIEKKFVNSTLALMDLAGAVIQNVGQNFYNASVLLDYKIKEFIFFQSNSGKKPDVKKKAVKKLDLKNAFVGLLAFVAVTGGIVYLLSQSPKDGNTDGNDLSKHMCQLEEIQPGQKLTNGTGVNITYVKFYGDAKNMNGKSFAIDYKKANPISGKSDITEPAEPILIDASEGDVITMENFIRKSTHYRNVNLKYKIPADPTQTNGKGVVNLSLYTRLITDTPGKYWQVDAFNENCQDKENLRKTAN